MRRRNLLHTLLFALASAWPAFAPAEVPVSLPPATMPASSFAPPAVPPSALHVKPVPENLRDLRALQTQVQAVVAKVAPAVVGLRIRGQGSGVIISEDGYVLTAGHVVGAPGRDVQIILGNGRFVRGKSLGVNYGVDSGLVKITDDPPEGGKWPFVEMGRSFTLQRGQWCVALGHPGGYKFGRTPPLRLGRILDVRGSFVRTDCTLVGGDSGGPLFDLDGRVIAIHSRIGNSLNDNMHVPVDTYRGTWDRLASGDAWGYRLGGRPGSPYLGFEVDPDAPDCRIGELYPASPVGAAGLRKGDVIVKFGGQSVANTGELALMLGGRKVGDEVPIEARRDGQTIKVKVTIGRWPTTQPVPPRMRDRDDRPSRRDDQ